MGGCQSRAREKHGRSFEKVSERELQETAQLDMTRVTRRASRLLISDVPLLQAAHTGSISTIERILSVSPKRIDDRNTVKPSMLQHALRLSHHPQVQNSALHEAAEQGETDAVIALLEARADTEARNQVMHACNVRACDCECTLSGGARRFTWRFRWGM